MGLQQRGPRTSFLKRSTLTFDLGLFPARFCEARGPSVRRKAATFWGGAFSRMKPRTKHAAEVKTNETPDFAYLRARVVGVEQRLGHIPYAVALHVFYIQGLHGARANADNHLREERAVLSRARVYFRTGLRGSEHAARTFCTPSAASFTFSKSPTSPRMTVTDDGIL